MKLGFKTDDNELCWMSKSQLKVHQQLKWMREKKELIGLTEDEQRATNRFKAIAVVMDKAPDFLKIEEPWARSSGMDMFNAVLGGIKEVYPKFYKEVFANE